MSALLKGPYQTSIHVCTVASKKWKAKAQHVQVRTYAPASDHTFILTPTQARKLAKALMVNAKEADAAVRWLKAESGK